MTTSARSQFGPSIENGKTRFRVFAPGDVDIALEIEDRAPMPMQRHGSFREAVADAPPGTRYRLITHNRAVPDPASRLQSGGVHGWSVVTDPAAYAWRETNWAGRPWEEAVIYEMHTGLSGGFAGTAEKLPALKDIGFTAIELMSIAAFPGARNWGYDGVLPFAPCEAYGTPDELRALVDQAHALGLMIYLDVVDNHFGPDGNYLALTAPEFFRSDVATPWGAAIDFRREEGRRFFIENAIYWICDFRFDGLRFDAVHAISPSDWLEELAREVRAAAPGRQVHLILENDKNETHLLGRGFDAQWNDDFHHVLHVMLTGETNIYYADYANDPAERLARILKDGFDYQGQISAHRREPRGECSSDLAPSAFVSFLQNHDQTGNRAHGERLTVLANESALRAAIALTLLAPQIPLVFMGEEIGSRAPFLYFTDHGPKLARAVREGRAREFAFDGGGAIPDPNAQSTFDASHPENDAPEADLWRSFYRSLLRIRREAIAPRLKGAKAVEAHAIGARAVLARWRMGDGAVLTIATNVGSDDIRAELPAMAPVWGTAPHGVLRSFATLAWLEPR